VLGSPAGWTLAEARGISADGRIIIGNGSRIGGGGAWIAPLPRYGDMNCDGQVTFADIDWFVEALSGESAWTHAPCPWLNADCNADGQVTFADIDPFVALIGTTAP
jgi:hypothetical protein